MTSALILPRSRKIGRILVNACLRAKAKAATNRAVRPVMSTADAQQHHQRDDGRHQAADEIHQARADQIAHAFDVGHDARYQHAALVGVVIADREASDVLLDFLAQLGDQSLAGFREQLRQGEGSDALDERGVRTASTSDVSSC